MNMWEENKETHLILGSLIFSNLICTFLISTSSNQGNNMFSQSKIYFKHTFGKRCRKSYVHLYYSVFICWEEHQIYVFFQCYGCFLRANRIQYISRNCPGQKMVTIASGTFLPPPASQWAFFGETLTTGYYLTPCYSQHLDFLCVQLLDLEIDEIYSKGASTDRVESKITFILSACELCLT